MSGAAEWAEVQRLHRVEGMKKAAIARRFGMSRNTVHRLVGLSEPPRYERASRGQAGGRPRNRRDPPEPIDLEATQGKDPRPIRRARRSGRTMTLLPPVLVPMTEGQRQAAVSALAQLLQAWKEQEAKANGDE